MRPVILALAAVVLLGAPACSEDPASTDDTAADGSDTDDGSETETDTGPISRPTTLSFTFNGISDEFKSNATASFTNASRTYVLMAQRSERAMVITITGAELGAKDTWTQADVSNGRVTLCFDDGGTPGDFLDCDDETVYTSTAYSLTITSNDGPGGYVDGTFTATMKDRFNDAFPLSGQFVLLHR